MENEMIERVGDALLKAFQATSAGQTAHLHSREDDDCNPIPDDLGAVMIDGIWDFRAIARAAAASMREQMDAAWKQAELESEGDKYAEHEFAWGFLRKTLDEANLAPQPHIGE